MREIGIRDLRVGDLFTNAVGELMILTKEVGEYRAEARDVGVEVGTRRRYLDGSHAPYTLVYRPTPKLVPGDIYRLGSELHVVGPDNTTTFLGDTDDKFIPGPNLGYPARGMGIHKKTNGLLRDDCELVGNMTELLMGLL